MFHLKVHNLSWRESRAGIEAQNKEGYLLPCFPGLCSACFLTQFRTTWLGLACLQCPGPLPLHSTIKKLSQRHASQLEEIPQVRFPLPRCVKSTPKLIHTLCQVAITQAAFQWLLEGQCLGLPQSPVTGTVQLLLLVKEIVKIEFVASVSTRKLMGLCPTLSCTWASGGNND